MSMEIPISTSLSAIRCSASSIYQTPSNSSFDLNQFRHRTTKKRPSIAALQCTGTRRRKERGQLRVLPSNSSSVECSDSGGTVWDQPGVVEVIGIGSRVDSVLDYCLNASSSSPSVRFWDIIMTDSERGKLHQRHLGRDNNPNLIEAPLYPQSCHKAVILVASAGYDDDHTIAIDILGRIRAANGLVVAIILRPFDFEGLRRQDEVKILLHKIQECTNFSIEIDINSLLKMDLVTLDEALRTTNRAVFLGISSVAVLISDMHRKHIESPYSQMKSLNVPGILKVLESYKEGAIGFGEGHNFETSILQAACHCPFLSLRLKDLDGLVICIFSSGNVEDCNAVPTALHTFRQLTECEQDVMLSVVYDPDLKPNVITTTVITVSSYKQKLQKKSSLLSKLVEHIPFFFNFLRDSPPELDSPQPSNYSKESSSLPALANPQNNEVLDKGHAATPVEGFEINSSEPETVFSENFSDGHVFREYGHVVRHEASEVQYSDFNAEMSRYYDEENETMGFQREPLLSRDIGLGSKTGHELIKERAISGASPGVDKPSIFHLPVGVRPSSNVEYSSDISNGRIDLRSKTNDHTTDEASAIPNRSSANAMTDVPAPSNGKYAEGYKKQGILSARAASMLEAERDSEKKWSRVLEIRYKGGIYKGHSQGGLPEGKGCLQFPDGSAYDGMWRYGKRSGLGTFYFRNGDVFQGTWRDDLMHGKGWFYFHNGDRWFSNFWKGQANGEGRFYSKSGEVFYGHFQDGWRHGRFQCVKHDGTRFVEIWEDGALLHREQLDFDTCSSSYDENKIK